MTDEITATTNGDAKAVLAETATEVEPSVADGNKTVPTEEQMVKDTYSKQQPPVPMSLEQKYIAILEEKCATLEKALASLRDGTPPAPPPPAGTADSKPGETKSEGTSTDEDKTSKEEKEKGTDDKKKSRVRNVISKWDNAECLRIDRDVDQMDKPDDKKGYAFVFRRTQDPQDRFMYSEVEIQSVGLKKLLQKYLAHYPGHYFDAESPVIYDPFPPLVHNWDKLHEILKTDTSKMSDEDKLAYSDLQILLDIVCTSSGVDKLGKYFREREQFQTTKTITYEALWTLFAPGTLVYGAPFMKKDQVFIVGGETGTFFPEEGRGAKLWSVYCWGYDWNGETFDRKAYRFEFDKFQGSKAINSLPIYPLEYYEDGDSEKRQKLEEQLYIRGEKFRGLCEAPKGKQKFSYHGKALYRGIGISTIDSATQVTQINDDEDRSYITATAEEVPEATRRKLARQTICEVQHATVMVDFTSYFQYADRVARLGDMKPAPGENVECGCPTCRGSQELSDKMKFEYDGAEPGSEWERLQYILCAPRVLGYVIERKMWAQLQVEQVEPVKEANMDTFDNKLKLDDEYKAMLRALVTSHESGKLSKDGKRKTGIDDFVQGKGKGLVILLHGPPGVGKSLTAESIAQRAGKPLFAVGVTDIGMDPETVQVNLERMFDLAGTWEAVLLIDEADVFLDARGKGNQTDLRRNGLVSVLLRILEYYHGILILTTNRIRDFDVAVQSRIHLAIKYEDLTRDQQIAIFDEFLSQARDNGQIKSWDRVKAWVEKEGCKSSNRFNGRQIRNIVSCALGLARQEDRKLDREDLSEVARMTKAFKEETNLQEALYRAQQLDSK